MKSLFVLCLLSISVFADGFDAATWPRDKPLPGRPGLTGQLDNGVRYAIEHRSYGDNEDKAYVIVLVETGSLYESEAEAGYAHIIEHVLFRGSRGQSVKKTEKFFKKMGVPGTLHGQQAFTHLDQTVFSLPIPENPKKNIPTAIKILAKRVGAPLFKADDVAAERDIVLAEEQQRRLSNADTESQVASLGKDHPLVTQLPIGNRSSLTSATQQRLLSFYKKWYRPDRMIVVVTGDVEPELAKKAIERHFGRLDLPKSPNPPLRQVGAPTGKNVAFVVDPELKARNLRLALYRDREFAASMDLMKDRMIASIGTSIVNNRLADYRNETSYVTGLGARFGMQELDFETDRLSLRVEDDYELTAFSEVVQIIVDVMDGGFTAQEISTTKQLVGNQLDRNEEQEDRRSNRRIANSWIESMRHGYEPATGPVVAAAGRVLLEEISIEEIQRSFVDRFEVERVSLVMGVPEGESYVAGIDEFTRVLDRLVEHEVSDVSQVVSAGAEPVPDDPFELTDLVPGEITEAREYDKIETVHLTLSNNAEVLFKANPQANSPVTITVRSPGGLSLIDDYDVVRAPMVREVILSSGLRGLKSSAIGNLFRVHRTFVSMFIGQTEHGFSIRTTPEELDFALRALHIIFTEAKVDRETFDTLVVKNRTVLNDAIIKPGFKFGAELSDVLAPGQKMNSSNIDPALLNKLTPEWIQTSFETLFAHAGGSYFVVSGPLDWQVVQPQILRYVGSLPAGPPRPLGVIDYPYAKEPTEIRRNTNPDERSEGRMFFIEPAPGYDNRMSYVRGAYANLLNQRLFKEIREQQTLVYSIRASASSPRYPSLHGQVVVSYVADPSNIEEIETRVIRIMGEMAEGVSGSDVKPIQKMQARGFTDALDKPGFMLGILHNNLIQGLGAPTPEEFLAHIESVDKKAVMEFAAKVANDMILVKSEYSPEPTLEFD